MFPPPPDAEPFFVAILDVLGFKSHLQNDAGERKPEGLAKLYEIYFLLLKITRNASTFTGYELTPEERVVPFHESVRHMIASDTIMLWATKSKARFLVSAISQLLNRAMCYGAPLRGALAYGDCIFDESKNILIGYPIVEAVTAEKSQEWIGVGILPNAAANLEGVTGVVQYPVPQKSGSTRPPSQVLSSALAWHWAEERPAAAEDILNCLCTSAPTDTRIKYQNALAFVTSVRP